MSDDVFDQPCRWRVDAARSLGLTGEEMIAVSSPGAAFPSVLESMVRAFPPTANVLVDIGAGGGGASEWLRLSTGATVLAVEPAPAARRAAQTCFPQLVVVEGSAADTGLPDDTADIVTLCGVWSLLEDVDPVLDEIERITASSGILAITDLFAHDHRISSAPNVFRTLEETIGLLADRGWHVLEIGCGTPVVASPWDTTAALVDAWIERHCTERDGYDDWVSDRDHLRDHIDRGDVLAGCLIGSRRSSDT